MVPQRAHPTLRGVARGVGWFCVCVGFVGLFDEGELSAVFVCFIFFYWPVQYF